MIPNKILTASFTAEKNNHNNCSIIASATTINNISHSKQALCTELKSNNKIPKGFQEN